MKTVDTELIIECRFPFDEPGAWRFFQTLPKDTSVEYGQILTKRHRDVPDSDMEFRLTEVRTEIRKEVLT